MKKFIFALIGFLFISVSIFAVETVATSSGVSASWLHDNWAVIALVISEALALTGSKWGGIVKIVLNLIGAVLDKIAEKKK